MLGLVGALFLDQGRLREQGRGSVLAVGLVDGAVDGLEEGGGEGRGLSPLRDGGLGGGGGGGFSERSLSLVHGVTCSEDAGTEEEGEKMGLNKETRGSEAGRRRKETEEVDSGQRGVVCREKVKSCKRHTGVE